LVTFYLITSFAFFLIAGLMAMIMRIQLFGPDNRVISDQQYNELFTMHGTIMLLLFATPAVRRVRERDHAAADRRAGRGVPPAEPAQLLLLPVRRAHPARQLPHPRAGRRRSAGTPTRR